MSSSHELDEGFFKPGLTVWLRNPYPQEADGYRIGRLVDPKRSGRPVYVSGKVVSGLGGGKVLVETDWEPKMRIECETAGLCPANVVHDVDDMVELAHLNDATLLHNVQVRYHNDQQQQIYTMAGPILIAVNPYRIVTDRNGTSIYDNIYVTKYRSGPTVGLNGGRNSGLPPHIFGVAANAVATFLEEKQNQSIVISGESGAGKTESTKQIMQYITSCTSSGGGCLADKDGIETKLLRSNPVLEALGNAKTIRNDNSSRFGKFIQIIMEPVGQSKRNDIRILGGSIRDYLLEKSRVVKHILGERNYHIFYQLIDGLSEQDRQGLFLADVDSYRYLNPDLQHRHSKLIETPEEKKRRSSSISGNRPLSPNAVKRKIDDKAGYEELASSLQVVGLGGDLKKDMFKVIASVLHLGNIELAETDEGCTVKNGVTNPSLKHAADLLGLDAQHLAKQLVVRQTVMSGQVITSPLDRKRAYDGIDALAKSIYGNLFQWTVQMINKTLMDENMHEQGIGILDIFGFEVFAKNGFEQFCINFANEKLHQLFTTHVFKLEQKMYEEEGIDYSEITFTDNQHIIDLIEKKPIGIFSLLDEACLFPRSTDETFLNKLNQTHDKSSSGGNAKKAIKNHHDEDEPLYRKGSLKETNYGPSFVISHSASPVIYTVDEFLVKNRDRLEGNITELLSTSQFGLVRSFFDSSSEKEQGGGGFTGSNAFLGHKFKDDINKLMDTLHATTPHFVRCLKANGEKRAGYMDPDLVLHQLRYLGVLDSIRIRHAGFSFRTSFSAFYSRFALVVPSMESPAKLLERNDFSEELAKTKCGELTKHLWKMVMDAQAENEKNNLSSPSSKKASTAITTLNSMIQLGRTKIFLRKQMIQTLEALRDVKLQAMDAAAVKIQSLVRMKLTKARLARVKRGMERLRSAWRAIQDRELFIKHWKSQQSVRNIGQIWLAKAMLGKHKRALLKLQSFGRTIRVRREYLQILAATNEINLAARRYLVRRRVERRRLSIAATKVQSLVRGYQYRQAATDVLKVLEMKRYERKLVRCAKLVQATWKRHAVRRVFAQIIEAVKTIQYWAYGFLLRYQFLRKRGAVRTLQRVGRGFLGRLLKRRMITTQLVEEETWRMNQIRYREFKQLWKYSTNRYMVTSQEKDSNHFEQKVDFNKTPVVKGNKVVCNLVDIDVCCDVQHIYQKSLVQNIMKHGGRSIAQIDNGTSHTIILDHEGNVSSFGFTERGQLGHGKFNEPLSVPKVIRMFQDLGAHRKIVKVATGDAHSLALASDGTVYAWGAGSRGQLGLGTRLNESVPQQVKALASRKVSHIACGTTFSAASLNTGLLYTWGGNRKFIGQGLYSTDEIEDDVLEPKPLKEMAKERVTAMSCGREFMAAVTKSGKVFTWGSNCSGQLGHGDSKDRFTPQQVPFVFKATDVVCGGKHTAIVDERGRLFTCGWNHFGQLGLGGQTSTSVPTRVAGISGFVKHVSLGWRNSVVITKESKLYVWGVSNMFSNLQDNGDLLHSVSDSLPQFNQPMLVQSNIENAGRVIRSVQLSKSHSISFSTITFEQKPATVAMCCLPLVQSMHDVNRHAVPLYQKVGIKEEQNILVDDNGEKKNLDDLDADQLRDLVRNLVQNPTEVRAYLDTSKKVAVGTDTVFTPHNQDTTFKNSKPARAQISTNVAKDRSSCSPRMQRMETTIQQPVERRGVPTSPFSRRSSYCMRTSVDEDGEDMDLIKQNRLDEIRRLKQQEREAREGRVDDFSYLFSTTRLGAAMDHSKQKTTSQKKNKKRMSVDTKVRSLILRATRSSNVIPKSIPHVPVSPRKTSTKTTTIVAVEPPKQARKQFQLAPTSKAEHHTDTVEEESKDCEFASLPAYPGKINATVTADDEISALVAKLHTQARADVSNLWQKYNI